MSEIRRVDPRRPIVITPQGLRRIVLGQVGVEELSTQDGGLVLGDRRGDGEIHRYRRDVVDSQRDGR